MSFCTARLLRCPITLSAAIAMAVAYTGAIATHPAAVMADASVADAFSGRIYAEVVTQKDDEVSKQWRTDYIRHCVLPGAMIWLLYLGSSVCAAVTLLLLLMGRACRTTQGAGHVSASTDSPRAMHRTDSHHSTCLNQPWPCLAGVAAVILWNLGQWCGLRDALIWRGVVWNVKKAVVTADVMEHEITSAVAHRLQQKASGGCNTIFYSSDGTTYFKRTAARYSGSLQEQVVYATAIVDPRGIWQVYHTLTYHGRLVLVHAPRTVSHEDVTRATKPAIAADVTIDRVYCVDGGVWWVVGYTVGDKQHLCRYSHSYGSRPHLIAAMSATKYSQGYAGRCYDVDGPDDVKAKRSCHSAVTQYLSRMSSRTMLAGM